MSKSVDQRIVQMEFDNKQFESGASTSIKTLSNLKDSLNFSGAAKGMEDSIKGFSDIQSAANSTNESVSTFGQAVEGVGTKFSALQTIAIGALAKIGSMMGETLVNAASKAGSAISSALGMDAIKDGFAEYETQINSVQTILSNTRSKGTTIDQVNEALDELNTYADQTIYNFTEMTRNIGTFTAAGIDLDTSVSSIKGIANLAAVSGSTSYQASTAMYQLSQALAAGTVKLQDWNSVVNAGMGGQVFQDSLKETARVMGIDIDDMIEKAGSFRETLQYGWLSSDVLTETLGKFAGAYSEEDLRMMGYTEEEIKNIIDLGNDAIDAATKVKTFSQLIDTLKEAIGSGWTQTWELIIGDYEEAKEMWTKVSDYFSEAVNNMSDARNEIVEGWVNLGGREAVISGIVSAFNGLLNILRPIKEAFSEIFPKITADQLYSISTNFKNLMEQFQAGTQNIEGLKSTAKGLFAVLDLGKQAVTAIASGVIELVSSLSPAAGGLLSLTGGIGDFIVGLDTAAKETNFFGTIVSKIVSVIKTAISAIASIIQSFKTEFSNFIAPALEGLSPLTDTFSGIVESIKEGISSITDVDISGLETFGSRIQSAISAPFTTIGSFLSKALGAIAKAVTSAIQSAGPIVSKIVEFLKGIGTIVSDLLSDFNFNQFFDALNGGILVGILLKVKSFVGSIGDTFDGVGGLLENVTDILDGVKGCLESYQEKLKADVLTKIATAIAILAGSILVISLIDSNKLTGALAAMSVAFADLSASMLALNKFIDQKQASKMAKIGPTLIAFATAILILSAAMKVMGSLDTNQLTAGLTGMAVLCAELVASAAALSKYSKGLKKQASGLIIFAAAMLIMSQAVAQLGRMSWADLAKGLAGLAGVLVELFAFLKLTNSTKIGVTKATGILVLSAAMLVLGKAMQSFAQFDMEQIGRALTAMGGLLAEIAVFVKVSGSAKHILRTAVSLTVIAAAMHVLYAALDKFSSLSLEQIGTGLLAMGGALAEIVVAMKLLPKGMLSKSLELVAVSRALIIIAQAMTTLGALSWSSVAKGITSIGVSLALLVAALNLSKGTLGGAASILVIVAAVNLLVPALQSLGTMSGSEIVSALVALGGALAIFAAAAALCTPIIPSMLGVAGAVALLGVGCLAAGVGIVAFAAGLSSLAVSITAIIASLGIALVSIVSDIPLIATAIGDALVEIAGIITRGAPAFAEAIVALVTAVITAVVEAAPQIVQGAGQLIVSLLDLLIEYVPPIVDKLFDILIMVIDGLSERIPELVVSVMNFLGSLVKGIRDGLAGVDITDLLSLALGISTIAVVFSNIPITGSLKSIANIGILLGGITGIVAILGGLNQIPGFSWLMSEGFELLSLLGSGIGEFLGSLTAAVMGAVSDSFPIIAQNLSSFMTNLEPFIDGAKDLGDTPSAMVSLAGAILALTAAEVIQGISSFLFGGTDLASFGEDISAIGPALKDFSDATKDVDTEAVERGAEAITQLGEMAKSLPNEGGVMGWFNGENNLDKFGEMLASFGPNLKTYAQATRYVDTDRVKKSSEAIGALGEMAKLLPNEGGVMGWFNGDNSLDKFGEMLASFGANLKKFAGSTRYVDTDRVKKSSEAIGTLGEMTKLLPNTGGVMGWFNGDNSLDKFGEMLASFGPNLKTYVTSIVGVSMERVKTSAEAISKLGEMAEGLPTSGGVMDWFNGTNDLSSFGNMLASFGPNLKTYSDSISDVDLDSVTTSANALTTLATAFVSLCDGGVLDTGTDISQFGSDLVDFGEALNQYDDSVKDVHLAWVAQSVSAITDLAGALASLPTNLNVSGTTGLKTFGEELASFGPNLKWGTDAVDGLNTDNVTTIVSAITDLAPAASLVADGTNGFGAYGSGNTILSTFGSELALFGPSFASFVSSIQDTRDYIAQVRRACTAVEDIASRIIPVLPDESNSNLSHFGEELEGFGVSMTIFLSGLKSVSVDDLEAAITQFERLAEMADVDYTAFNDFSAALTTAGETGVTSFVSAFQNGSEKVKAVVRSFIAAAISVLTEDVKLFKKQGSSHMSNYITGMKDKINDVKAAVTTIVSTAVTALVGKSDTFKTYGTGLASALASGITAGQTTVTNAVNSLLKSASTAASNSASTFTTVGKQISNGLAKGVTANTSAVVKASASAVKAAEKAAKKQAQIKSPSRVFAKLGMYMSLGMAKGISDYSDDAATASASAATTAAKAFSNSVAGLSASISDNMDTSPTIRPVLDLSGVESGTQYLDRMLSGRTLTINGIDAQSYASSFDRRYIQNGSQTTNQATSSSNDQIIRTINNIGERLDQLGQQMTNMKVVMDTGATVGQLETTIDKRLGVLAGYRERRL